ncbi:hypothetical protein ACFLSE_04270 [Bacteroidota bacterium]
MQENNNSNVETDCKKVIPLWLVLLDNIPTLTMYILGSVIISFVSANYSLVFITYSLVSIIWFWARICPYCHYHGTFGCPCGYGIISSKFFQRKEGFSFRKVFKRNIIVLFPSWFIPPAVGIYLLIKNYSLGLLILVICFAIVGFVLIPIISKKVGCKDCEIKDDCPWMK